MVLRCHRGWHCSVRLPNAGKFLHEAEDAFWSFKTAEIQLNVKRLRGENVNTPKSTEARWASLFDAEEAIKHICFGGSPQEEQFTSRCLFGAYSVLILREAQSPIATCQTQQFDYIGEFGATERLRTSAPRFVVDRLDFAGHSSIAECDGAGVVLISREPCLVEHGRVAVVTGKELVATQEITMSDETQSRKTRDRKSSVAGKSIRQRAKVGAREIESVTVLAASTASTTRQVAATISTAMIVPVGAKARSGDWPQIRPAHSGRPKPSSKLGIELALLEGPGVASLARRVEVTGWLPHTTRAALTGLRKSGFAVVSKKSMERGASVYRIRSAEAA